MRCWTPLLLVALATGGCPGTPDQPSTDDGGITCQTDRRAETYTANMQKPGRLGALQFTLVQSDPAPPGKGTNTWTLKLQDKSGNPVTGATVTARPLMPDHGHGTSVVPQVTPAADGTYGIAPLYLFMAGLWQITLNVQAGATTDVAVFSFCIQG